MKLRITVEGRTYDVEVELLDAAPAAPAVPSAADPPASAPSPPAARPATQATTPVAPVVGPVAADGDRVCRAPLPGTVTQIKVRPGERVTRNQTVVVLEAMKMESSIGAPADGTVKSIPATLGASVREGDVLVELE